MASNEARELVRQLEARGLSRAAIGRAVGRDSGMVSQIARDARGAGYGAGLVPALQQLAAETGQARNTVQARGIAAGLGRSGELAPARRQTKAGRTAAVRRSTQTVGARTARQAAGKSLGGTGRGTGATVARVLDSAARNGQAVSVRVEIENNTGPGTRWITVSDMAPETWRYLLGLDGDKATMRQRLQTALDDLAESGELSSDVTATGNFQVNVEAI